MLGRKQTVRLKGSEAGRLVPSLFQDPGHRGWWLALECWPGWPYLPLLIFYFHPSQTVPKTEQEDSRPRACAGSPPSCLVQSCPLLPAETLSIKSDSSPAPKSPLIIQPRCWILSFPSESQERSTYTFLVTFIPACLGWWVSEMLPWSSRNHMWAGPGLPLSTHGSRHSAWDPEAPWHMLGSRNSAPRGTLPIYKGEGNMLHVTDDFSSWYIHIVLHLFIHSFRQCLPCKPVHTRRADF